jgi:hypothetical protein
MREVSAIMMIKSARKANMHMGFKSGTPDVLAASIMD